MPLGPGSRLGNVVLREPLGEGAMGCVWLADHRGLDSEVAVKVLHGARARDERDRARFEREARGQAQLDSPHVVRIFDYGVTDEGEPYIVMERLVGRDLKTVIEQSGTLSIALTRLVMRQLCRALGHAHERGVLHRDIKPANLFVVEADGEPFIKVLDFGIAKHRQEAVDLTETGQLVGTPHFMSPEQFVAPREVDARSDLWSAAVVAYACLAGELPFAGETVGALSLATYRGEHRPPSDVRPDLPPGLDGFFARALAPRPEARFADAKALWEAFDRACEGVSDGAAPAASEDEGGTDLGETLDAATMGSTLDPATMGSTLDTETMASTIDGEIVDTVRSAEEPVDDASRERASWMTSTTSSSGVATELAAADDVSRPTRWRWVAGAAAVALVAWGLSTAADSRARHGTMDAAPSSSATGAESPEARPVQEAAPSAAVDHERRVARLGVVPAHAKVRVDGVQVPVREGAVVLEGAPGQAFAVEVSLGSHIVERTVVMQRDGQSAPRSIAIGAVQAPPPVDLGSADSAEPVSPPTPSVVPREGWR